MTLTGSGSDRAKRRWGLQEGEQKMLLEQLRHKFGELTDALLARVRQADEATLDDHAKRAFTADSI